MFSRVLIFYTAFLLDLYMFIFEFPSDKIEDTDVNSFEVIDDWYLRDESFVFYEGKK